MNTVNTARNIPLAFAIYLLLVLALAGITILVGYIHSEIGIQALSIVLGALITVNRAPLHYHVAAIGTVLVTAPLSLALQGADEATILAMLALSAILYFAFCVLALKIRKSVRAMA